MNIVYIVALVVLLIIGVFLVWTRTERGSEWWLNIKGIINTGAKQNPAPQEQQRDIIQRQEGGEGNIQTATKGATSQQEQINATNSEQIIK